MPTERITMRRVRDLTRLKIAGVSTRETGLRAGAAPAAVRLTE
ncbi:MAG: hypothetical protein WBF43_12615 [Methylocella sp.]